MVERRALLTPAPPNVLPRGELQGRLALLPKPCIPCLGPAALPAAAGPMGHPAGVSAYCARRRARALPVLDVRGAYWLLMAACLAEWRSADLPAQAMRPWLRPVAGSKRNTKPHAAKQAAAAPQPSTHLLHVVQGWGSCPGHVVGRCAQCRGCRCLAQGADLVPPRPALPCPSLSLQVSGVVPRVS